ncbi:mannose-P-dolichol utilization defect 1 protein isoform X1 [Hydra vulgaris]|nr:mannose-P-dolichol utilization defect 1 protein [Hydra vulgaris]
MAVQMTYFFTPLVLMLISEECHDEFFVKFNILNVPCLKIAITKGLGCVIIVGSMIVKVPQIIKLLQAKSGEGLNIISLLSELAVSTFSITYAFQKRFPFSSWGEALFLAVQNGVLVILINYYNKKYFAAFIFTPIYCGITYFLSTPIVPIYWIVKLQEFNLVFIAAGRLLQIVDNYSMGHTGQLSFVTTLLITVGGLARVLTSLQETGDMLMTLQFVVSSMLNAVILAQLLWYWNVVPDKIKKKVQ